MNNITLPEDFLLGCGTSSIQTEGGDTNNNWYMWCRQEGRIKDGSSCVDAIDHWNRYQEDIDLIGQMNNDTYRMSIEWSRIEPENGRFDIQAINHYRDVLNYLLQKQIRPLVTLYHFSHPLWFSEIGEWENPDSVFYFKRYTEYVLENLGDLVAEWITINEPSAYIFCGFGAGIWPPGKKSLFCIFKVMKNMILGHIESYKAIHDIREKREFKGKTKAGFAMYLKVFEPHKNTWLNKLQIKTSYTLTQDMLLEGLTNGKLVFPLGTGNYPLGRGKYYDFFGVNYYSRDILKLSPKTEMLFTERLLKEGADVNSIGWEIYPEGLYRVCKQYYKKYNAPIFITENGFCDDESDNNDEKRCRFIYEHLKFVAKCIAEDIPIKRYYYWTLVDNFEWIEGTTARFGLVHNDFITQKRTMRNSGLFYGEICKRKAVTGEMLDKYLKPDIISLLEKADTEASRETG